MKSQHIILKSVFLIVLVALVQGLYVNVCGMSEIEKNEGADEINSIQVLENNSKLEKFLAKIDKCFDDDFKKVSDKRKLTKRLNNVNEKHSFGVDYKRVSKAPLFLLYSSLKVDC